MNDENAVEVKKTQEGTWVDTSLIDAPDYARKANPEGLDKLGADLDKNGQLQNIVLIRKADGRYEAVIGNRRLAAAKKRGWKMIRADVKENISELQKLQMVVAENEQREDACPFYTAMIYGRMMEASGKNQEEFAREMGKDQTLISRYAILAKVPAEVWQDHLGELTTLRQCLEIAKVPDVEHQKKLAQACAKEGLTGPEIKKRAKALRSGPSTEPATPAAEAGAPKPPFQFIWKGHGLLIKGRLFNPHTESLQQYFNEIDDAYNRFMEEEKTRMAA